MADKSKARVQDQFVLRLDEASFCRREQLRSAAGELRVFVPYTSVELTKAALTEATVLARNLDVQITLFAVQIVPFPLPLERPAVAPEFLQQRLLAAAGEIEAAVDVELIFARDLNFGMQRVLPPNSLVVVATKKSWWPTSEAKLAKSLTRAGHSVTLLVV
jgi:hypothetical protein